MVKYALLGLQALSKSKHGREQLPP